RDDALGRGFLLRLAMRSTGCAASLAFSGKVGIDLGFTRDRHSILLKSATADLSGFPQKMRPDKESRGPWQRCKIGRLKGGILLPQGPDSKGKATLQLGRWPL